MGTYSKENVASPVSSLPVEILILIFDIYLSRGPVFEDEFHGYYDGYLNSRCSPLILMQVCSHWRAIALATPSLWTFICPSYNPIRYIRHWLAICPKYPLDLQLANRAIEDVPRGYVYAVFNLFTKEAHRWRSLSIDFDHDVAEGFVKLLQSDRTVPLLLEDLKIEAFQLDHMVPVSTFHAIAALLSRLKALRRLIWVDSRGEGPLHGIPWSQLKTVTIKLPSSLEDIFSYLSQCTSATQVEFCTETPLQPQKTRLPSHRLPPLTLPHLTSIRLSRGCDPMWLLQHFTMPSLQHLEIGVLRRNQPFLEEFVKRSPHLHTLIVDERYHEDYDLYVDQVPVSDHEIIAYLTNPSLRAIPRVGIDLTYAKERTLALIQQRLDAHRPLPPLLCWRPSLYQRLVGWWDKLDPTFDALLFSYKEGSVEFSPEYEFDDSDCLS
ncbi:unnamed protein product [Cyclocybe aegerita]|uniref:F-box domain-containing protein n=1 Tax=Cyclocybe aegerita TaxID=1973307 RepID=A0A8S0W792_CYCAE|nr:unnamed protein product [Cyclocybe aegerita]